MNKGFSFLEVIIIIAIFLGMALVSFNFIFTKKSPAQERPQEIISRAKEEMGKVSTSSSESQQVLDFLSK